MAKISKNALLDNSHLTLFSHSKDKNFGPAVPTNEKSSTFSMSRAIIAKSHEVNLAWGCMSSQIAEISPTDFSAGSECI